MNKSLHPRDETRSNSNRMGPNLGGLLRWMSALGLNRYGYVLALVGSAVLVLASARTAAAYNNVDPEPCQWPYSGGSSQLTLYYANAAAPYAPSGDYASALSAARTSWFYTATPSAFAFSSSSLSVHGAGALGSNFGLGATSNLCSGSTRTKAILILNSTNLSSGPYSLDIFWKQFAAAHEQGHHISLGHSTVPPTIMPKYAPNASTFPGDTFPSGGYNGPVADDVCGVNVMYPSTSWPPT